jgi:hypothetical protein
VHGPRDLRAEPALEPAQRLRLPGRPVEPAVQLGRDSVNAKVKASKTLVAPSNT